MNTIEPPVPCAFQDPRRFAADKEVAGAEHVHVAAPGFDCCLIEGSGRCDSRIRNDNVDAAVFARGEGESANDAGFVGNVAAGDSSAILAELRRQLIGRSSERVCIVVQQDHACVVGQQALGNRAPDAAGAAGYESDSSRERFGRGLPAQLGLFQRPVLDVKCFLLGQAEIFVDGGSAAHDADRVAVELGRDTCGWLVFGEGEHADRRHQDDDGVRIAHRRRIGSAASFVVGLVVTRDSERSLRPRTILRLRDRREE